MIRVGDLVRVLQMSPAIIEIPGIERVHASELVDRVWRVQWVHGGRIHLDFREGDPPRQLFVGRSCPTFESHQLEVVGRVPIRTCEHLTPVLTAMLEEGGRIMAYGDIWPAKRNGVAVDRRPGSAAEALIGSLPPEQERWLEVDPHHAPGEGLYCRLCGDALNWPASR